MSMTWELGLLINNRYQIQEIIYQSPFECDYLVTDKNQNDKICILKNLINKKSGEISIIAKRFHQDLNIIKSLEHPQIQKVKDFFWQGEHIFIAQDYIEGQSYQNLLQMRLSLTEEEAIELLKKILPVLSYLHNQQIVHGDISPSNLVLRSYDNLPVLTNFGVMTDILTELGGETFQNKLLERIKRLSLNITLSDSGKDLYALAMTVVMLLTGQEIEVLFNPQTQTWDWENWKLVSDQLASVLNRMLSVQVMNSFDNAEAILEAVNFSVPATVLAQPFISPPPEPHFPSDSFSSQSIDPQPTTPTTTSGLKNWQKAVITAAVIGSFAIGSLWVLTRQQSLQVSQQSPTSEPTVTNSLLPSPTPEPTVTNSLPPSPTPEPTVTNSLPPSPTPEPTVTNSPLQPPVSLNSISQQDAVNLVNTWLQAKREMLAPPYNRQIAAEITTGEQYNSTAGSDGSIDWLQNNNAYYKFGVQKIESVERFVADGNQATIQVKVTEERTLYKNGNIDPNESDFKTRNVIYNLQLVDGRWKIASTRIIN